MSTKRKSREQKRIARKKQKISREKKAAFLRSLIFKDFSALRNGHKKIHPAKQNFAECSFEFILAADRYNQKIEAQKAREILFRRF
ncbi:MAG: hypothetical protein WDA09_06365 [Bacteriovoracaceae bacterium]